MQSKGAIKFVAVLLLIASLWQLSFTLVSNKQVKIAEEYAIEHADAAIMADAAYETLSAEEQAFVYDSYKSKANRYYLDSISSEKVYCGYTFREVQEKAINLGLDLKGGMNVMLQVQMEDVVRALAEKPCDEFNTALAQAKELSKKSKINFVDLFAEQWEAVKGDKELSAIFKIEGDDAAVIAAVKEKADMAIDNSFQVLSKRIDRFGVTQPNIQKISGGNGRILVELPGVKEPERVRKLLQGTASLEFWPTFTSSEVYNQILAAEQIIAANSNDSTVVAPIREVLSLENNGFARLGIAHYADTAKINSYFAMPEVKAVLNKGLIPMWSAKPIAGSENYFELVAIKDEGNGAPLDGDAVAEARAQFAQDGGDAEVSMSMNREGAKVWARLTGDNIKRQVAIVLDGLVYSYPTVNDRIEGGNSQITGNFTPEEAQDLANVLECGKLPAPAKIIQESVVGPTLGAKSINAGLISFIIAFVLVLIYMILFYSRAGLAADIALLVNVVFLFGTLVSFGAVLTLPGIAGLVLTLGMAVDANVIIYERVKEELRAGKGLSKAIEDGYSNAYSAIIDGQITTLLTGIVLFVFGSGPVQGFATTLIIGIITSIITSIFVTRLYFEGRLAKGKNITFDNKLTRNFLQNTKVNFLGKRKIAYIVSGVLVLASLTSIFTKGFTYGVDFVGGRTYVVKFDQNVNTEDVRKSVVAAFDAVAQDGTSAEVKQFGSEDQVKITTTYKTDAEGVEVDAEVAGILYESLKGHFQAELTFPEFESADQNPLGIISSDKVGAAIAAETKNSAILAVVIALVIIFAYIAVRFNGWTWGLGGVVGLAHTAIIVIGFFSIFTGILPFTLDVDQTFIAAILTIIGYAINDTVVIFDRIREYKMLHPKADFGKNVNAALNSTLSRTMNTSLTTLITMLAIAIFGGEAIRGLAVALILGIVIGTYASVFIATPIMYDLTKKAGKKAAAEEQE
ncbi:MAG: protein translocase subunit SecD [Bacteroidales bacterium]|nr:protein translocase subunit SecD [Bacteroidales bacterium]